MSTILAFILAITTTLEYEDARQAADRQSATNYTDAVAQVLQGDLRAAAAAATNYTDSAIAAIPSPDFSPSNATLVATIEATSPAPGDYATVSNLAVHAVQASELGSLETDPTVPLWAKDPSKPSYAYSEIAGVPTTWAWSDITGKPTTWAWSAITGKPSWIGSSKPSYAYSEITGKPIIPDMQADGTMVVASTNAWSSDIAGFTPGDGSLRPPALFVQHSEPDGGGTLGYTTLGATNYWAGLTFDGIHYDVMTGGNIISTGSLMFTNVATKSDHYTKAATDQRIAELAPNPSNVVTQAFIQERLGVYLYIGQDGHCYVHVPE